MAQCKTAVPPLLTHWRYCSITLCQRFEVYQPFCVVLRPDYFAEATSIPRLLMPLLLVLQGNHDHAAWPRYCLCQMRVRGERCVPAGQIANTSSKQTYSAMKYCCLNLALRPCLGYGMSRKLVWASQPVDPLLCNAFQDKSGRVLSRADAERSGLSPNVTMYAKSIPFSSPFRRIPILW